MFKRSTVILILLALVLIVGSWVADTLQTRQAQRSEQDSRLLALDIDQVQRIQIERPAEDPSLISLEVGPDDGGLDPDWRIVEPVQAEADAFTVRSLLRSAADLKWTSQVEGEPNLADFGLDPAIETVSLTLTDGSTQVLKLGDPDFDQTGLYAMTEAGSVVIIPNGERMALAPSLYQLRDKVLLSVRLDRLESIQIERAEDPVALNYDQNRWQIVTPERLPADEGVVSRLVNPLVSLQAASFVSESTDGVDLAELGLADPVATVALTLRPEPDADQPETVTVTLGSAAPNNQHYALTSGSPAVVTVFDTTFNALLPSLEDLRSKALLSLELSEVDSITIESQDPALARTLLPSADNPGQWQLSDQPDRLVSLNSLWQSLSDLQATAFVPENNSLARRALADPRFVLTIEPTDQPDPVVLSFGVRGRQAYAQSPLQPEVAQLDQADFDEIETLISTFRPIGSSRSDQEQAESADSEATDTPSVEPSEDSEGSVKAGSEDPADASETFETESPN